MKKRVSKKLLFGLGSTLAFSTTGIVIGLGLEKNIEILSKDDINLEAHPSGDINELNNDLEDSNLYNFDFEDNEAIKSGSLKEQINVQSNWLKNKKFPENSIMNLNEITIEKITKFETDAISALPINNEQKNKLKIKYYFRGSTNPVDKNELLRLLKNYQNPDKFNILQLWNGQIGEKIEATFDKKDQNGNYELVWDANDPRKQVLDTGIIITTVDLTELVRWLERIKVSVSKTGTTINSITFPTIEASGIFNKKEWIKTEQVLESLAIKVHYQQTTSNDWYDEIIGIKRYDQRAQFRIRFFLQKLRGKNLIVKIKNGEQLIGTIGADKISSSVNVNLDVPKLIRIDPDIIHNFRTANNFSGNTKQIEIDQNKLDKLISDLKKSRLNSSLNSIQNAPLQAEFRFGDSGTFKPFEQWKKDLAAAQTDQTTNWIQMIFTIPNASSKEWEVEIPTGTDGTYTALTENNNKVPIYVHDLGIQEGLRMGIQLTGDNANLRITFPRTNGFTVDSSNRISGSKGNGLRIQFSFDESLDVDATTGWLNNRPTSAPVGTNKIFMRIIPVDSWHIYEKKVENQYQKIEVNFQVAQRLTVDSQWINQFQLGDGTIELSGLTEQKINEWISKIQNQVKINNNNLDDTIVKKVSIKFTYKNRTNLDAKQLYEAIRIDRENFANSNLGIVQLWNGTKGEKITARFVGLDNSVIIRDANGNSVVSDVINTNNIYTQIDLSKYVNILKTVKTTVQQGSTLGQMDGFTPPQMSGTSGQFAGKTYEEISNRLKEVGIDIQFANNTNGPWQSKENTTTYNPQTAVLYLAFTNQQNNNIKLLIENNFVINAGSNNQNNPIKLILNLPKQITIKNTDLTSFNTAINFSGNTKAIDFDANAIQTLINKILERNSNEANGDQSFKSAPLMIEFKIGNSNWTEWTKLKTFLNDLNTDLTSKAIKYRFKLANNTNSEWSLETNADQERDLFDENNSPLKIYINDNEIFNDLKQTKFNGTNQALEWKWKQGISVDKTSGQLRKNNNIGVGLKIAYSFDQNKWVNQQPTSYSQDVNKVYLKIQLEDPAKFVYDKTDQLIELSLNLPVNVSVEKSWLEQDFITSQQSLEDFITNIQQILTTYEDKVFAAAQKAGISDQIKTKFKIQYLLGENNNLLDQKDLIKKIQNYATENINNSNFGILQLWNNDSGIKIKAQFSDADQSDNFNITVNPNQEAILLNTSKVVTTIDFSSVINWLTTTTMKVPIEDGNTLNSINEIKIPQTSGLNNSPFNNREWSRIENVLNYFGITIEYKPDGNVINPIWGSLNSVKVYDPASGQIQFKFKFDKTKSKNLKLKLDDNTIYDGATTTESSIYKFNLKVRLNLLVEPLQISEFIKNAAIGGDTKFVEIDPQAEQKLITSIKEKNALINPEFNNVNLKIEYYLGSESDPNIDWKEWIRFKSDLASQTIDQKSNRIIFKLSIDQSQDDKFSVTNTTYILHNDQTDPSTWGVKYFVNTADLETNASQINVSGTSSKVTWNYGSFGKNKVDQEIQTDGKKIFIKNNYGQRILQVFFSTKENISYDETESNNLNDITSKWVSIEPNHFLDSWKVSKLYIKLVSLEGYVYEAKKNKLAKAHEISLANLKLEIKVDPESLRKPLNLSAGKNYLHELNINDITNFVNSAINTIAINKEKVDVKFRFKNKLLTAEQLLSEIQNQLDINNGLPKNIIQLWNGTSGEKIEAQFIVKEDLKDQYILIDNQNNQTDANRFIDLNTTNIKTLINLKEIVKGLAKLKINVTLPNRVLYDLNPLEELIMPNLPDGNESELQGLTWNQFETKLSTFGITIEARPKVKGTNNELWSSISNVQKYDSNLLSLELRFRVNAPIGQNIVLSVLNDGDVDVNKSLNNLPIFEMSLKAPAKVVVNNNFLDEFTKQEIFTGDTKYLKIVSDQPESNLIQAIIDENIKNNPDVYKELAGRLEVQYYLGQSDPTQANVVWRSAKELQQFLSNQTEDQITNQIWYRLNIKAPNNENEQIFHIDQSARILVREEINTNAKIKIYINETGFSNEINNFRALGSTDGFTIDGLNSWKAKLPKGLEVGYSKDNNPDETDDSKWTLDLPSQLNNDKKLWLRFKVEEGYVFQNALKDNPKYVQKHAINTEGIKVIIKLKKEWLEQILITGNVKEASINEEKVLELIKNEGILPPDQPELIELEYNIKGTSEWLTKTVFESKLKQMSGAKDSNNFIIKREDLQVRFNIKTITRNDNFGLNIDGQNIEENNRYKFNVDLVNRNRNEAFKGYINLDHLENFRVENFKIIGSTNKPKLIITKRKELDQLFMPYASDDLFDIQFSTTKDANGEWNWNNLNQSILRQGQLIDEEGLITQGIQISANKYFAIRFISKNSNYYDVYKDGVIKNDGYTLDLSNNVQITIEITNPFSADNKTLGLWTRENNGAKMKQNIIKVKVVLKLLLLIKIILLLKIMVKFQLNNSCKILI